MILHVVAASANDPLYDWLAKGGALGILAAAVVAFLRGWIHSDPEFKRVVEECRITRQERDRALDLVYRQAEIASRALQVTESQKGSGS